MLPRLDLRRGLVRTGVRLQVARGIYKHDHSPVTAVFHKYSRQEEAWSLEAMNAYVAAGWKRLEVVGGCEKALEENKAKFDRLVDTLKTADAINDFCIKTVASATEDRRTRRSERSEAVHKYRSFRSKRETKQWRRIFKGV